MTPNETQQIEKALRAYEHALNASDVEAAVAAYHADGAFMPDGGPTSQGSAQVRAAYQHVFQGLDFDVVFGVEELEQHGDWAIVRTTSKGAIKVLATGEVHRDDRHREFFLFTKRGTDWKIARYMFNKPQPHTL